MSAEKLEFLVVAVPGLVKSNSLEHFQEIAKLGTDLSEEIKNATHKCKSITQIEGHQASIIGLKMMGYISVKNIEVTYLSKGETHKKIYSKEKFYEL